MTSTQPNHTPLNDSRQSLIFGVCDRLYDNGHCITDVVLVPANENGEPDFDRADPANIEALPADEWPEDERAANRAAVIVSNIAGCHEDSTFLVTIKEDGDPVILHIHGPETDRDIAHAIIGRDIGAAPVDRPPSKLSESMAKLREELFPPKPAPAAANDNIPSPARQSAWGKLELKWFDDIGNEAKRDAMVKGMLGAGEFTMASGLPGSGKSVILTDLACHVAAGREWFGRKVKQGLVVFIAAERKKLTERRMMAFRKQHGASGLPLLVVGGLIDLTTGQLHAMQIAEAVRQAEKECGRKCVWIIIDTLTRTFGPGDQHQSKDMAKYVRSCDVIRAETGAHLTVIHHTSWAGERGKGAIDLDGAVDASFMVKKTASGYNFYCDGANDLGDDVSVSFRMESVEIGIDDDGAAITAPVVIPTDGKTAGEKLMANVKGHAAAVLEALEDVCHKGAPASDEDWRRAYYGKAEPGAKAHTLKTRYLRAKDQLIASGTVTEAHGTFRPSHGVTCDADVTCDDTDLGINIPSRHVTHPLGCDDVTGNVPGKEEECDELGDEA